ncbi:mucin-2-like [Centruroides sculpturatus]|uniref:mucin-2-like n=1 Tax=Centruroides sculpturatus TaxID=218467 RepID=UPI000C6D8A7B|nr:mucin-2-like [Centruroides sculpturatus]
MLLYMKVRIFRSPFSINIRYVTFYCNSTKGSISKMLLLIIFSIIFAGNCDGKNLHIENGEESDRIFGFFDWIFPKPDPFQKDLNEIESLLKRLFNLNCDVDLSVCLSNSKRSFDTEKRQMDVINSTGTNPNEVGTTQSTEGTTPTVANPTSDQGTTQSTEGTTPTVANPTSDQGTTQSTEGTTPTVANPTSDQGTTQSTEGTTPTVANPTSDQGTTQSTEGTTPTVANPTSDQGTTQSTEGTTPTVANPTSDQGTTQDTEITPTNATDTNCDCEEEETSTSDKPTESAPSSQEVTTATTKITPTTDLPISAVINIICQIPSNIISSLFCILELVQTAYKNSCLDTSMKCIQAIIYEISMNRQDCLCLTRAIIDILDDIISFLEPPGIIFTGICYIFPSLCEKSLSFKCPKTTVDITKCFSSFNKRSFDTEGRVIIDIHIGTENNETIECEETTTENILTTGTENTSIIPKTSTISEDETTETTPTTIPTTTEETTTCTESTPPNGEETTEISTQTTETSTSITTETSTPITTETSTPITTETSTPITTETSTPTITESTTPTTPEPTPTTTDVTTTSDEKTTTEETTTCTESTSPKETTEESTTTTTTETPTTTSSTTETESTTITKTTTSHEERTTEVILTTHDSIFELSNSLTNICSISSSVISTFFCVLEIVQKDKGDNCLDYAMNCTQAIRNNIIKGEENCNTLLTAISGISDYLESSLKPPSNVSFQPYDEQLYLLKRHIQLLTTLVQRQMRWDNSTHLPASRWTLSADEITLLKATLLDYEADYNDLKTLVTLNVTRGKRGLIDTGGKLLKYLFGVATTEDIEILNENIARLTETNEE